MDQQTLKNVLDMHRKWVLGEPSGERANLSYANLRSANLSYANLSYANLRSADLSYANLRSANLSYANLSYANLRSANLSYANLSYANLRSADLSYANLRSANLSSADLRSANLSSIKEDFFKKLALVKSETVGLYDFLRRGKVDGTAYEGECACFVGSIANLRKENHLSLSCDLKADASSPTERWFLAILKGDTPENNPVAQITAEWMEEFMGENSLVFPKYKLISSAEFPLAFEEAK